MRFLINDAILAVQLLTRIPVPLRTSLSPERQAGAVRFYPLAGLLIGVALAVVEHLLRLATIPPLLRASLIVALWVALTGAMHLDGLMDTADGLLSNRGRERALEIMKDSRAGAMGVVAAMTLILVKWSAVASIQEGLAGPGLVLCTVAGRAAIAVCIGSFPYARAEGLGGFAGRVVRSDIAWACGFAALGSLAVAGPAGLLPLLGAVLAAYAMSMRVSRFLGGLTGDVYGALCEMSETLALVVWVLVAR